MPERFAQRLDPVPMDDWSDATHGRVHDPVWFLTRQWQLGEFQGENASTPVKATIQTTWRPIVHTETGQSMEVIPPEVFVESERDDWWTLGRRLRIGALIAGQLRLKPTAEHLIADPPPPYDLVQPAWDGRAMWRDGLVPPGLLAETPPPEPDPAWLTDELVYERRHAFDALGVQLDVKRHGGGRMDWYSVDAELPVTVSPPHGWDDQPAEEHLALPTRLDYPGMPRSGVWEIEDTESDPGGFAPDAAHTATAIMTALFFSHRDEWFDIPVPSMAGRLLRIVGVDVADSFGEHFIARIEPDGQHVGPAGLHPPVDRVPAVDSWYPDGKLPWGLFHTRSLASGELLIWQAVDRPLEGEVIERVQFGVDDLSNLVWAVERRLEQREPARRPSLGESLVPPPPSNLTRGQAYNYLPSVGAAPNWIPYPLSAHDEPRALVQHRLVDLSRDPVDLLDPARADVLAGTPHTLRESVIPVDGLQVERRWMLTRGADGNPHLWIQRSRRPLLSPPARMLRFDVAAPTDPEQT